MVETEHRMAKGTFYLMIAQAIFILSGYVIHFVTARIVDPIEYGRFGVILAILQILQIFLVKGIPDAVTKYISEDKDFEQIKKISLKFQGIFSIIIFLSLILFSSFISNILKDSKLTYYIILISLIIPIRALFSLFIGFINGFREFRKASFLFNINNVLRVLFVFLFLFLGFGIFGIIGGYILSSFIALILCVYFFKSKTSTKGKNISSKDIIIFATPMIIFSASYLMLMNFDILFIKAFLKNPADAGYYTAARTLSSVIFGVLTALTFSLLPSISKSVSKNDTYQIKNYITLTTRYLVMILLPIGVLISIYSSNFLSFFYPIEYNTANLSLSILVFGTILISFFVIFGTILSGAGKPKIPMWIGIFLAFFYTILNYFLVNRYGMTGGALSTLIIGLIGFILSGLIIFKEFKVIMSGVSFLKILIATIIIGAIAYNIHVTGYILIGFSTLLIIIYIFILLIIKELKNQDIQLIKTLLFFFH